MVSLPALSLRGRIAGWCVAAGLVLGGLYQIVFVDYPAKALRVAQEHYAEQLAVDFAQANELTVQNATRTWFQGTYTAAVAAQVVACETALKAQPATAEFAGMSAAEARSRLAALSEAGAQARRMCDIAGQLMAEQDATRIRATEDRHVLEAELKTVAAAVVRTADEFRTKRSAWLAQYSNPLAEDLLRAASRVTSVQSAFAAALQKLPQHEVVRQGDPDGALVAFDAIRNEIKAIGDLGDKVANRMAFMSKADQDAVPTAKATKSSLVSLEATLYNVAVETRYTTALQSFTGVMQKLQDDQGAVEATLASGDKVLAYERGLVLQNKEEEFARSIDTFLTTFRGNKEDIRLAASVEVAAANYAVDATRMLHTLRLHHADSEWRDVADVDSVISGLLAQHRKGLAEAVTDNGLDVQNPVKAASGLAKIKQRASDIELAYEKLTVRYETLEDYRTDWPSAENAADRAIENERPQIETYGRYDSNAQSSFESAVSYYNQGLREAAGQHYGDAIDTFNRAVRMVSGVGDDAESSYDDEQRRQRRAAAEAAAARARAAQSDDSSDSNDSSFGYTPSYSSDSYSSSGGDFSFGSSGDGGDWGGGSTSSDGGDW